MNRYDKFSKIDSDKTYSIPLYPDIEVSEGDILIVANETTMLSIIALKFWGRYDLWYVIALVNNLPGDSIFVEPGTHLIIPKDIKKFI